MTDTEASLTLSRRSLLKAAGITVATGSILTAPATAEQGNSEENRQDQENRPEGVGTSPAGVGTSPMGFGTSPLAEQNTE